MIMVTKKSKPTQHTSKETYYDLTHVKRDLLKSQSQHKRTHLAKDIPAFSLIDMRPFITAGVDSRALEHILRSVLKLRPYIFSP